MAWSACFWSAHTLTRLDRARFVSHRQHTHTHKPYSGKQRKLIHRLGYQICPLLSVQIITLDRKLCLATLPWQVIIEYMGCTAIRRWGRVQTLHVWGYIWGCMNLNPGSRNNGDPVFIMPCTFRVGGSIPGSALHFWSLHVLFMLWAFSLGTPRFPLPVYRHAL